MNLIQQSLITKTQKIVFYISLVIIPLSVFPLPWDLTEYSMGLMLSIFASIILLLEVVKGVYTGKFKIYKSSWDIILFLLVASTTLSTLFSQAKSLSLWGFDYRLGSGAVIFILSAVYFYISRSFIVNKEDIFNAIKYISYGIATSAIISILSFYGYNLLTFIPSFKELFTTGLPLYSSARISVLIWSSTMIVNLGVAIYYTIQKQSKLTIPHWIVFVVTALATLLFSINQGGTIVIFAIIAMVLLLGLPFIKKRPLNKHFVWTMFSVIVAFTGLFALLRIDSVKELIIKDDVNIITQVSLDTDVSWKIASSSVSQSITQGLFGMGSDTFSVAYNLFRPLSDETIILNNTNFTYAGNHILNTLSNMGIIGLLVFAYALFFSIKNIIYRLGRLSFEESRDFILFTLDLVILFILFSSFLTYFNFLTLFLIFFLFTMQGYFEKNEHLEINMDFGSTQKKTFRVSVSIIVLTTLLILLFSLGGKALSMSKVLKAETKIAVGQREELSTDQQKILLIEVMDLYGNAASLSPTNSLIHRRTAILISQHIQALAGSYNETDDVDKRDSIFNSIAAYTEVMIDQADKASDISPQVYSNWVARSDVYTNLVGLGLTTYTHSALSSLQEAAKLNPLNYDLYYSAAQLYIVQNDVDSALVALNQVFGINGRHIPSLILAGELSSSDGDLKQAERYYTQAKETMEEFGNEEGEIYEYIIEELIKLGEGDVEEEVGEAVEEVVNTEED